MAISRKKILFPAFGAVVFGLILLLCTNSYYLYLTELVLINLIVVFGLNVVLGFAGQATVGHAALFAIGAYTSAILVVHWGWPVLLSGLMAMLMPLIAGLLLAIPSFKLGGVYLAVLTIAFNLIIHQLIISLDQITKGPVGITGIPPLVPNSMAPAGKWVLILCLVYVAYKANRNILRSFFIRELWAIRENEFLASSFGINTYWTKVVAFEVSAIFAGLGGFLYGHIMSYISPDLGSFFSSVMFVMMLIAGGSGTLIGPIIGTVIITVVPELMHEFDYYRQSIFGILLVLIALFSPKGIYGLIDRLLYERRHKAENDNDLLMASSPRRFAEGQPILEGGAVLRLVSIEKSFGGVRALSGVSLEVKPSTVHCIIGPNGSGKTTLINIISGLFLPDGGDAAFAGESIVELRSHQIARKGITRTFQNINLLEDKSVMENVLLGLHPWWRGSLVHALLGTAGSRRSEYKKRAFCCEIMDRLEIRPLAWKKVSELSYGQKKLVEVARSLASQPRLLLLDEPTSGLGGGEIEKFIALLRKVMQTGLTILLIEHHMDVVKSISDYITVLDEGRVIAQGSYEEVARNQKVAEAYLGEVKAV